MFAKFHAKEIVQVWVLQSKCYWFLSYYAARKGKVGAKYSRIDTWREDVNIEMFKVAGEPFRN